jgi:hypothetical protein
MCLKLKKLLNRKVRLVFSTSNSSLTYLNEISHIIREAISKYKKVIDSFPTCSGCPCKTLYILHPDIKIRHHNTFFGPIFLTPMDVEKVKLSLYLISTTPWRRIEEWRYSCTILDLSTGWRWVIIFTLRPLYHRVKSPLYQLNRRLCGPRSWSTRRGVENNLLPPPGMEPRPSSWWPVAMSTELSRLLTWRRGEAGCPTGDRLAS